MKTAGYIILGAAAIGGVLWYMKKKSAASASTATSTVAPSSAVDAALPKPAPSIVDPAALVKPLILNPGIVPPTSSKTAVAPAVTKTPALTLAQKAVIAKTTLLQSGTRVPVMMGLRGLGSTYLMN